MAWETEFEEFLPFTITVSPFTGQDAWGEPAYGPSQTYSCRVMDLIEADRRNVGTDIEASHKVWVNTRSAISPKDKVVFSEFSLSAAPVLRVQRVADEDDWHHTVLYFGKFEIF